MSVAVDPRIAIVEQGYDRTAAEWAEARSPGREGAWLTKLCAMVPAGARVLDLGCGNGMPIARALIDAGFAVTGVDVSAEQLRIAATRVPEAALVHADAATLELPARSFAGVVAWDSLFHLPPELHAPTYARLHGWLAPGAPLLVTLGGSAGELHREHLGASTYFGALAPSHALAALGDAGFTIVEYELDAPARGEDGGYLIVLARA